MPFAQFRPDEREVLTMDEAEDLYPEMSAKTLDGESCSQQTFYVATFRESVLLHNPAI